MKTTFLALALCLTGTALADESPEKGGCKCSAAEQAPTTPVAAALGGALALGLALRRGDRSRDPRR